MSVNVFVITETDCKLGPWQAWTPCAKTCGHDSIQERTRSVIREQRPGGAACGPRIERRYCTLPNCPTGGGTVGLGPSSSICLARSMSVSSLFWFSFCCPQSPSNHASSHGPFQGSSHQPSSHGPILFCHSIWGLVFLCCVHCLSPSLHLLPMLCFTIVSSFLSFTYSA